jgi:hypothetical protein
MSTISPFVRIEGSINQPRSRAADFFPPPFGAEWALRSPEGSLRADLSALLRTFCLHDETIWSMCHWSSAWPGQPAVRLAEPDPSFAMPPDAREPSEAGTAHLTADAPAISMRSELPLGVRIAGAGAMGGAALLAWIAIGHLQQPHADSGGTPVPQAQHASDASRAAPLHTAVPKENSAQTLAPIALQPHLDEAHRAHHAIRKANRVTSRKSHAPASQRVTATRHTGVTASSSGSHGPASSAVHRRPLARPSAAGGYSPFAPARLGSDEYPSVTMPAAARLRDAVLAPSAIHRSPAGEAEWMSHISQRRVTEVPDEFAK